MIKGETVNGRLLEGRRSIMIFVLLEFSDRELFESRLWIDEIQ